MPNAPSSRSSCVAWFDADNISGVPDNTTLTTSATVTGANRVGPAWTAPSSSANCPVYRAAKTLGHACLTFPDGLRWITPAATTVFDSAASTSRSMTFVIAPTGTTNGSLAGIFSYGASYSTYLYNSSGAVISFNRWDGTGGNPSNPILYPTIPSGSGGAALPPIPQIFTWTRNNSTGLETIYQNGIKVHSQTVSGGNTSGAQGCRLGASTFTGAYGMYGDVAQVILDNVELSQAQVSSDVAYFAARYNTTPQSLIFCVGDSRTAGSSSNLPSTTAAYYPYPLQLQNMLPNAVVVNLGMGGATVETVTATFSANVLSNINPLFSNALALFFAGVNDYGGGSISATTAAADFISGTQALEAGGILTIPATDIDYESTVSAAETYRSTFNSLVVAGLPSIPGKRNLLRLDLDPILGPSGASQSSYFYDLVTNGLTAIHLTGKAADGTTPGGGYGHLAALFNLAIQQLLTPLPAVSRTRLVNSGG